MDGVGEGQEQERDILARKIPALFHRCVTQQCVPVSKITFKTKSAKKKKKNNVEKGRTEPKSDQTPGSSPAPSLREIQTC